MNSLQAGSFNLFTLTFDTLAIGFSSFDISLTALGDADGLPLSADVGGSAAVTVIPVPGALMLGGLGFGLVTWFRRRRSL